MRLHDAFVQEFAAVAFGPPAVDSYNTQKGECNAAKGPVPAESRCGGVRLAAGTGQKTHSAAHWKQWDAKPAAKAPKGELRKLFDAALVWLRLANRRKRRDAKPEAKARNPAPCPFGCDWQTIGNGGTQSQRLKRGTPRHARSVAAGKPLETMGRKARG